MIKFQARFFTEIQLLGRTPYGEFQRAVRSSRYREDVDRLWLLLDYCGYLARDVHIPNSEPIIAETHQATLLYLLCAGIDTWASKEGIPFRNWIAANKEVYGKKERDELLSTLVSQVNVALEDDISSTTSSSKLHVEDLRSGFLKLHDLHSKQFGLRQSFRRFFREPPVPAMNLLTSNYLIGQACWVDEVHQSWEDLEPNAKLERISDYVWDVRRNKFTHEAQIEGEPIPNHLKIFGDTNEEIGASGRVRTRAKWIVGSTLPEHVLLRSALVASVRQAITGDVEEDLFNHYASIYLRNQYGTQQGS